VAPARKARYLDRIAAVSAEAQSVPGLRAHTASCHRADRQALRRTTADVEPRIRAATDDVPRELASS